MNTENKSGNKRENESPSKWERAEAMTVHELLEENTAAAAENIPDSLVVSYRAMELCAGRNAKAVVHGLLLATLRILTDCEDDGNFEIPNAMMTHVTADGCVAEEHFGAENEPEQR